MWRPSLKLHARLFAQERFTTTLQWGFYLAVIAVIFSLLSLTVQLTRTTPEPPDLATEFNRMSRVQWTAQNYLRLWLTATEQEKGSIKTMLADQNALPTAWASDPVGVSDVNVADLVARTASDGQTIQWFVVVGATLTTPGNDTATRLYYATNFMDRPGTAIRAVTLPRPVNLTRPNVVVNLDYPNAVPVNNNLGAAVSGFASAYYTDQTGALPRFTTREFSAAPIAASPYTSTELLSIRSHQPFSRTAASGTTLDIVAQIKAAITLTSFQTISVPMKVRATDNSQWVVAELPEALYYSSVSTS